MGPAPARAPIEEALLAGAYIPGLALLAALHARSLAAHRERFGTPHPPSPAGVR